MLVLTDDQIQKELSMQLVIDLVEQAFVADAQGNARAFRPIVENVGLAHAHFGVKSGYLRYQPKRGELRDRDGAQEVLGLKAGGYWANNMKRHGLPKHRATILLLDPDNGEAMALMGANVITRLRTAAAGAVAARHLARSNASSVTILGTGEQAHAQLEAIQLVREIRIVDVWDREEAGIQAYIGHWQGRGVAVRPVKSLEDSLRRADIIITTTPAVSPLVLDGWIADGTHINAIGADGAGKKEIDPQLIQRSKFVPDKFAQSVSIGELQGVASAATDPRSLVYAELGQICAGMKAGRQTNSEITIFDSSGVSFQDLVVAHFLVRLARERDLGRIVPF